MAPAMGKAGPVGLAEHWCVLPPPLRRCVPPPWRSRGSRWRCPAIRSRGRGLVHAWAPNPLAPACVDPSRGRRSGHDPWRRGNRYRPSRCSGGVCRHRQYGAGYHVDPGLGADCWTERTRVDRMAAATRRNHDHPVGAAPRPAVMGAHCQGSRGIPVAQRRRWRSCLRGVVPHSTKSSADVDVASRPTESNHCCGTRMVDLGPGVDRRPVRGFCARAGSIHSWANSWSKGFCRPAWRTSAMAAGPRQEPERGASNPVVLAEANPADGRLRA
ncbi:hypothetical protein FB459_2012 [Yimella lutea]|uniref:Uncharacterized protein n=1 Tax=Yimella lutea TaxID=587872 RepID=A0A542EGV9_9MICO|nr:hypothetical protein FB459_2012 [Yimella lutea]